MNIAQVISIGLSCFSLGMAIANLIWFLATTRENRKILRAQRKKYREDRRTIILRIADEMLRGDWVDAFGEEKSAKINTPRRARREAKKAFKSGLWWLRELSKGNEKFDIQLMPAPEINTHTISYKDINIGD